MAIRSDPVGSVGSLTYQEMIKMLYKNSYYIKFEEKTVERDSDRDRVAEKLVERLLKCLNPEKE